MKNILLERLRERVLLYDGAVGTLLQAAGLQPGECPEAWNLSHPDTLKSIYGDYVAAGSDLILTFTFCANRLKLREYGLEDQVAAINRRSTELAKEAAAPHGVLVAGDIGPTGQFAAPVGPLSFRELYEIFREQVLALRAGGADVINIETMADLGEMRAAVLAAKENTDLPVICQMTFGADGRTFLGTDPTTAAVVMEAMGADVVGANCSGGPEELLPVMAAMAKVTALPLVVKPNAGLPQLVDGKTVFPATPELMADYAAEFVRLGVNIVGGCCGNTPEHIRAMSRRIKGSRPVMREVIPRPTLASRTKTVIAAPGRPLIIGERINPTGRKELATDIRAGQMAVVRREARDQVAAGADVLDVNVGTARVDEKTAVPAAVIAAAAVADCPLAIDTADTAALEAALQVYHGKALVNSVTGEAAKLAAVLPLVKKYGAAVIGLTLDENGIPPDAAGRLTIARRIVAKAKEFGIKPEDVYIDCLTLTAGAAQDAAAQTLRAVRRVKDELKVPTVLGVSNISYGLPDRGGLNAVFLTAALANGLDAAIVDPGEPRVRAALAAWAVLQNTDRGAREYIAGHAGKANSGAPVVKPAGADKRERLVQAVLDGDKENIGGWVEELLQADSDPIALMDGVLIPALARVGEYYETGRYFLPQLMLSAEAMQRAFGVLERYFPLDTRRKGKVVLATVRGDIHDIGKNILAVLLQNYGYSVTDLGKDVPAEQIVAAARLEAADVVGLSALMTTTMVQMPVVIAALRQAGLDCRVIIGGAVTTADYARSIGADAYAKDAQSAVQTIAGLIEK